MLDLVLCRADGANKAVFVCAPLVEEPQSRPFYLLASSKQGASQHSQLYGSSHHAAQVCATYTPVPRRLHGLKATIPFLISIFPPSSVSHATPPVEAARRRASGGGKTSHVGEKESCGGICRHPGGAREEDERGMEAFAWGGYFGGTSPSKD